MGIINGWEFILLIILAVIILGPKQLPEYAQKLARAVMYARRMARDARGQIREQMGDDYQDVDWRQYDPRQYDPRRIVREALLEPLEDAFTIDDKPTTNSTADAHREVTGLDDGSGDQPSSLTSAAPAGSGAGAHAQGAAARGAVASGASSGVTPDDAKPNDATPADATPFDPEAT